MAIKSKHPERSLESVLEIASNLLTDQRYDLSRAKAPAKKRQLKNSIGVWSSIEHYLTIVQMLTAEELEAVDKRMRKEVKDA